MSRKGIPGRTIDGWQRLIVDVSGCHQRDPMSSVSVKVDASDLALTVWAILMTLKKKVRPVVIVGIRAALVLEHEVGILVGLCLGGLNLVNRGRQVARCGDLRPVVTIAIVAAGVRGIFQLPGTLGHY